MRQNRDSRLIKAAMTIGLLPVLASPWWYPRVKEKQYKDRIAERRERKLEDKDKYDRDDDDYTGGSGASNETTVTAGSGEGGIEIDPTVAALIATLCVIGIGGLLVLVSQRNSTLAHAV